MKNEILRINNLSLEYNKSVKLKDISICLLAGECVGFLGLENSGKDLVIDLICGKYKNLHFGYYLSGMRLTNVDDLYHYVYKINILNYSIIDWTVAEYIFLVEDGSIFGSLNKKKLIKKAEELFQQFGIDIDVRKKLKRLTELEKRLMDLLRAYYKKAKIIVIEDEFQGCSKENIIQFKEILNQMIAADIAIIICSHSNNVSHILSDRYIIFNEGSIVKKINKKFTNENFNYEDYLHYSIELSNHGIIDYQEKKLNKHKEIVYIVNHMNLKEVKDISFTFHKGEVVTILALDLKMKKRIFDLLAGRVIDKNLSIILNRKVCDFHDISDFVKNRIASIADMGGVSELLLSMSAVNNLLLPSLRKLSSFQHMWMERKVIKVLEKEVKDIGIENYENVNYLSVNECIMLLMNRWYIYKPNVLILFEPFVHCDSYGVSLVKSYIKKYTEAGTSVIIVQSREEYVDDISNRMIKIK